MYCIMFFFKNIRNELDDLFFIGRGDFDSFVVGRGGGMMFDLLRIGILGMRFDFSVGFFSRFLSLVFFLFSC